MRSTLLPLLCAALLCGCTDLTTPDPIPNPEPDTGTLPSDWTAVEGEVHTLVNELRTSGTLHGVDERAGTCAEGAGALPALAPSKTLRGPAHDHAHWLATYAYTAHDEPDASDPAFTGATFQDRFMRMRAASSVKPSAGGENVAGSTGGTGTQSFAVPINVVRAWLHSHGHCLNMMSPEWTHMGVAAERGTPAGSVHGLPRYEINWVQVFGRY